MNFTHACILPCSLSLAIIITFAGFVIAVLKERLCPASMSDRMCFQCCIAFYEEEAEEEYLQEMERTEHLRQLQPKKRVPKHHPVSTNPLADLETGEHQDKDPDAESSPALYAGTAASSPTTPVQDADKMPPNTGEQKDPASSIVTAHTTGHVVAPAPALPGTVTEHSDGESKY